MLISMTKDPRIACPFVVTFYLSFKKIESNIFQHIIKNTYNFSNISHVQWVQILEVVPSRGIL